MSAVLEAHLAVMELAKANGDLRTVHGYQYPLSDENLRRWEDEQREARRLRAKDVLRSVGPLLIARRAFK